MEFSRHEITTVCLAVKNKSSTRRLPVSASHYDELQYSAIDDELCSWNMNMCSCKSRFREILSVDSQENH